MSIFPDRRHMLIALAGAPLLLANATRALDIGSRNAADDTLPEIPSDLAQYADQPSLNGNLTTYQPQGTQAATTDEEDAGKYVLDHSPINSLPIEVAFYFLDVKDGKIGSEFKPYVTAWPVRWNPVIVGFFKATNTKPSGDTTAWCAAFVNYCLLRSAEGKTLPAGYSKANKSASSRSFRTWASETGSPRPGDIVVFRDKRDDAHGHVGFFLAENAESVLVLGGNQFEGKPIRHSISSKWIPKNGNSLVLHSYRTDPRLQS